MGLCPKCLARSGIQLGSTDDKKIMNKMLIKKVCDRCGEKYDVIEAT